MSGPDAYAGPRMRFAEAARVAGRLVRWQASVGALVVTAFVMWRTDAPPETDRTLIALCTAAAVAPILIDPAAVTLASSPTPVRRRHVHRMVWIAPALIGWMVAQWIFIAEPHRFSPPRWAWVELTTSLSVVLAAELTAARLSRATGLAGVGALICLIASVVVATRYVALLPVSEHELRVALVAVVAFVWCRVASRDPALRNSTMKLNRRRRSARQSEKVPTISEETWKSAQVGSSEPSAQS